MADLAAVDLAIVIVNWRVYDHLDRCLAALPAALAGGERAVRAAVVVVDNESDPARLAALAARHPGLRTIANPENRGFAAASNQGLGALAARFILLLNPDTVPGPGSLARLLAHAEAHPRAAVCGPALENERGGLELTCRRFPRLGFLLLDALRLSRIRPLRRWFARYYYGEWDYASARTVEQVSGACFLIRGEALTEIGPLDERFFLYFEEVDWCLRARDLGWECWFVPAARVRHVGGASSRQALDARVVHTHRSLRAFYAKHRCSAARAALELVIGLDTLFRRLRRALPGGPEAPSCAGSPAS